MLRLVQPLLNRVSYGWIIVATLAVTQTVTWGVLYYSFAVFLTAAETELGWERAALTGAFSLALLCSGLVAPFVGRWIDRHGGRLPMTLGSIGATLLVWAWAHVDHLPLFYLIWMAIGLTMALTLYEPAFAVVTTWFVQGRARALATVTFVAGFSSTIFIPLADLLLQRYGWRTAIMLLGLVLGGITIPLHALVLRQRPQQEDQRLDGEAQPAHAPVATTTPSITMATVVRSTSFWGMTAAFMLATFTSVAMITNTVPYLLERGLTPSVAARTAGLIGAMQVVGRVLSVPFDGRLPRQRLTASIFGVQAVALLILLLVPGYGAVLAFVVLFGASYGVSTLARPALIAERYGVARYGQISGLMALWLTGASALAPIGAGLLYTVVGGYTLLLWVLVALSLGAMSVMTLVGSVVPMEALRDAKQASTLLQHTSEGE